MINSQGHISNLNIVSSSGHDLLDQMFIDSVQNDYHFKPKRIMGKDQSDTIRLKYQFKL